MTDPHHIYDFQGWGVEGIDLPDGTVRFTMESKYLRSFETEEFAYLGTGLIQILLSFFKINANGDKAKYNRDKRWCVSLKTYLGSRLLSLQIIHQVPYWCERCGKEPSQHIRVCKVCKGYSLCYLCYLRRGCSPGNRRDHARRGGHADDHGFFDVDLGECMSAY